MLLNLPRRGWQWHRTTDKTPSTLCLRCQVRRQHSVAVESLHGTQEKAVEPQRDRQSHQQKSQGAHPPRPPRRYIESRRKDIPLRSFQFMKQEPRPRPAAPRHKELFPPEHTSNASYKFQSQVRDQGLQKDLNVVASVTSLSSKSWLISRQLVYDPQS